MAENYNITLHQSQVAGFEGDLPKGNDRCVLLHLDSGIATLTKVRANAVLIQSLSQPDTHWSTENRLAIWLLTPIEVQRTSRIRLEKVETDSPYKVFAQVVRMFTDVHPREIRRLMRREHGNLICSIHNVDGEEIGTVSIENEPDGWVAWTHLGSEGDTDCTEGELAESSRGALESLAKILSETQQG